MPNFHCFLSPQAALGRLIDPLWLVVEVEVVRSLRWSSPAREAPSRGGGGSGCGSSRPEGSVSRAVRCRREGALVAAAGSCSNQSVEGGRIQVGELERPTSFERWGDSLERVRRRRRRPTGRWLWQVDQPNRQRAAAVCLCVPRRAPAAALVSCAPLPNWIRSRRRRLQNKWAHANTYKLPPPSLVRANVGAAAAGWPLGTKEPSLLLLLLLPPPPLLMSPSVRRCNCKNCHHHLDEASPSQPAPLPPSPTTATATTTSSGCTPKSPAHKVHEHKCQESQSSRRIGEKSQLIERASDISFQSSKCYWRHNYGATHHHETATALNSMFAFPLLPHLLTILSPTSSSNCTRHALTTALLFALVAIAAAGASECDFEKYGDGCFTQANFYCDRETNQCKCLPAYPILIDQRFCLKRAKANEICEYNEQCDTSNEFYCSYNDVKLHNQSKCPPPSKIAEYLADPHTKCRCSKLRQNSMTDQQQQELGQHQPKHHRLNHQTRPHWHEHWQQQNPQSPASEQTNANQSRKNNHSHSTSSFFPRLVWISLILVLFALLTLLFLIKFQSYRSGRAFLQTVADRQSIQSETDVPPPYEIAIRMKY